MKKSEEDRPRLNTQDHTKAKSCTLYCKSRLKTVGEQGFKSEINTIHSVRAAKDNQSKQKLNLNQISY